MRQWFGAKEVARQVNDLKLGLTWTPTHGHLVQMGGLGRLDDDRVLHPTTLIKLLENNQSDIAELKRVSKKRIEDHSKGDIVSKGVVALQTTWFIFECLARLHQKLPLLELEVVTLAFAVLNTLTYLFWWDKPLNVLCPIYLHILPPHHSPQVQDPTSPTPPSTGPQSSLSGPSAAGVEEKQPFLGETGNANKEQAIARSIWGLLMLPVHSVWTGIRSGVKVVKSDVEIDGWLVTGWNWLVKKPIKAIAWPLSDLFNDSKVDEAATHVSMFYGAVFSDEKWMFVMFLSCLIGSIFGAIHFLSWHSSFPTHTQLVLWRVSTIILVAQPSATAIEFIIGDLSESLSLPLLIVGLIAYVFARFRVLVLAFLTLRDPPPGAFETIAWTTYTVYHTCNNFLPVSHALSTNFYQGPSPFTVIGFVFDTRT